MENLKVSDILSVIEDVQLEWQNCLDRLCQNSCLSDHYKDTLRIYYAIRIDTLEQLKLKFV